MELIKDTTDFHIEGPTAVAIGKFDGIHKGHRKLISDLIEEKNNGRKVVIFTFDPSPASFFAGHIVPGLSTRQEKRAWFAENGIDVLIEFPMNAETAATPPEEFVKRFLVEQMGAAYVAAGLDEPPDGIVDVRCPEGAQHLADGTGTWIRDSPYR